jgi:epoxyqueuosine reductase
VTLTDRLKEQARRLGFDLVGVTLAQPPTGLSRFESWLANGYAGEMGYLETGAAARSNLNDILSGTRSILMVAISYHQPSLRLQPTPPNHGRVASYALGRDYHPLLWDKLNILREWLTAEVPGSASRGVVDTAPLLERDYARLAGLGWFGKNTMLIHKQHGSFFLLGALLTTVELDPDPPHVASHCGTCTACLDACPTAAFPEPGVLDATRCISYHTIELRGSIPVEHREGLDDWLFGCDICQDVCPWNRKAPSGREPALLSSSWHPDGANTIDLVTLLEMDEATFRSHFRHSALWRTKRLGLFRNACIVLGNRGDVAAIPALQRMTEESVDDVVRESAAWALTKLTKSASTSALVAPAVRATAVATTPRESDQSHHS